jgi:hypothetical protein
MAWSTASAAHLLGGGSLPPAAVIAAAIVLSAWPMTFWLGGRASGRRLVCLLAGGQATMHVVFVVAAAWSMESMNSVSSVGGAARMPGMPAGSLHSGLAGAWGPSPSRMVDDSGHMMSILPGPGMMLAHLSAALILGYVLADGERALFSLLGLLGELARPVLQLCRHVVLVLTAALSRPGTARAEVVGSRVAQVWRLPRHLLVRAVTRRGPPLQAQRVSLTV